MHGDAVARAFAGQRTAINLGGVEAAEIERGMTLTLPGRLRPTQIVDAQVQMLADAPRALRSRQRVRVHLGAAEVFARVRVLEAGGTGVPPVNHAQDARATIKLTHYDSAARIDTFINRIRIRATRASLA